MSLNRTLGLPMLTFYGTGMILGAGIYSIIGQAAGIVGAGLWLRHQYDGWRENNFSIVHPPSARRVEISRSVIVF